MHGTLRIIDANFNRSREGLRVMEEYARFCLEDATLSERCKTLRHELGNAICALQLRIEVLPEARKPSAGNPGPGRAGGGENHLIAARDTQGDVGTRLTAETEKQRSGPADVALAAAKRLTEALRAIEEYGKTIDAATAGTIEAIRYRAYEIEQSLALTARARERFGHVRLYVLITESLCRGDWFETVRAAIDNGADCIQLREKELSDAELLARARRLAQLCRNQDTLFIVNDRPDIAACAGAHGVHLGQDDIDVRSARRVLPPGSIVGVSTHTIEQIESAVGQTPDYIAVGPMFFSETKRGAPLAGCETLLAARERTGLPLVAIGGLDGPGAAEVLQRVPCCICACSSIISRSDVAAETRKMRSKIAEAWQCREDG